MAVCFDYQLMGRPRPKVVISAKLQVTAIAFLAAVLALKVWTQLSCTSVGYELAEAREQTVALDMEKRELELQLSVLLRRDNLSKAATHRLGLQPLKAEQARRLKY